MSRIAYTDARDQTRAADEQALMKAARKGRWGLRQAQALLFNQLPNVKLIGVQSSYCESTESGSTAQQLKRVLSPNVTGNNDYLLCKKSFPALDPQINRPLLRAVSHSAYFLPPSGG